MDLFKFEDYNVVLEPAVLQLEPFKRIYKRDKDRKKGRAMLELSFIFFYSDPRSDYQYITNLDERREAIVKGLGLPSSFRVDKDLQAAIDFYESFKPIEMSLLDDAMIAVDKVRTFLRDIDLYQLDDKGKPVHTLASVTTALKQVPILASSITEAKRAIIKDMETNSAARGSAEKTVFEDGIDF